MNIVNATVRTRKIQISAPTELPDGPAVSVLVADLPKNTDSMASREIACTVHAMDLFAETLQSLLDGEDLSAATRTAGVLEKNAFFEQADRLAGMVD